jgi:hypothetical protein
MAAEFATEPCGSCQAPIIWAETRNGRSMPVDPEPTKGGNVLLTDRTHLGRRPLATVLGAASRFGRTGLRESHFVTCPHSTMWRRKR